MRFARPSVALVIAVLALLLAAGGGAFAAARATGSAVNIVDATVATRMAKVSASGGLQVSGAVTATQTSPANFLNGWAAGVGSTGCVAVLVPPAGKAMVLKQITVNAYLDPSPGPGNNVAVFKG